MARIDFCWELGAQTGHVTTLLPFARELHDRGHRVRFLIKDPEAGADLEGMRALHREGAPHWSGPPVYPEPRNFGEILHNFAYHDPRALRRLVDAWRERLWLSSLVVANVAPTAHIAARTLGIPSLEISQSFHIPPPVLPVPPLRDWMPAPRAELEAADRRVMASVNTVLASFGVAPLPTIGHLVSDRAMILTYPELDIYPERGPADYYGIPKGGQGRLAPPWPEGRGARVFAYLYHYYPGIERLLEALVAQAMPSLVFCRSLPETIHERFRGTCVSLQREPMATSEVLPQCDLVLCHASHQTTAQALLAGKPVVLVPTQLEQFLITRRVVRMGAGLGIAPETYDADFGAALREVAGNPRHGEAARAFAARYAGHDQQAAFDAMLGRCEAAARAVPAY